MNLAATASSILRARRADTIASAKPAELFAVLVLGGVSYGFVMGASQMRPLQMLYSGIKVPILLTASSLICLPSFFVVNTMLGLRDDFAQVRRGLVTTQLTMAIVLASLAPMLALVYASASSYRHATLSSGVIFLVASLASQIPLARIYGPLIASNPRHRIGKRFWLLLYVFVTIQLAWVLRPFIGSPGQSTTFLRQDVWDNAYVVVAHIVWRFLGGE